MIEVTVERDTEAHPQPWCVSVAGMKVRFASQSEAQAYGNQLQERIAAPHDLLHEELLPEVL
ncbi:MULTISPECIES: hypothetical protein [Pseudomonadaceae]|uniref:DUF2188 domain-containing protein n=1 Tax=Ectopseudomonas oleovorans TaxID=301 RepID=A0A3D9EDG8_ECTOL|nr:MULTISPECIES: hypothetical protein [Pseudomonas]RED00350.1 hypothetical protein DFO60_4504 [Pseudomonas oleovorans]